MDRPTVALLDALKHPGGIFLEQLCKGPATEDELLAHAPDVNQSTGNRRLELFRELGLAEQDPGKKRSRGRRWRASVRAESAELLTAALKLSEVIAEGHQAERETSIKGLQRIASEEAKQKK